MNDQVKKDQAGRRAFFLRGGAALGAGLAATTAGAAPFVYDRSAPLQDEIARLRQQLSDLEDSDAIRHLFLTYHALLEQRAYPALLSLFTRDGQVSMKGDVFHGGERGLQRLFTDRHENQAAAIPVACRPVPTSAEEKPSLSADRRQGWASWQARVRLSKPLSGPGVLEQMARLQGQGEQSRWETGRFDLDCVKVAGHWKIRRLDYHTIA